MGDIYRDFHLQGNFPTDLPSTGISLWATFRQEGGTVPGRVPRDASETINLPLFDLGEDLHRCVHSDDSSGCIFMTPFFLCILYFN